jgi:archaellum component FlaF (FlaF/FlaG flagellin family)
LISTFLNFLIVVVPIVQSNDQIHNCSSANGPISFSAQDQKVTQPPILPLVYRSNHSRARVGYGRNGRQPKDLERTHKRKIEKLRSLSSNKESLGVSPRKILAGWLRK